MKKHPLLDKEFLQALDLDREREIFAKIISLNLDEEPLQEISGAVTTGTISIDGSSAVRRTCSLTMVTSELSINQFYWGLHTKFKLYIGLKNKINDDYPEIIWFPQGTFLISSFSTNYTTNNYTINISGKDKMCYLNGELGGTITALTHDFGTQDYTDEYGFVTNSSNTIHDIIIDAVHEFAHEPFQNIIINDLDEYGVELLEYRGEEPMYFLIDAITGDVSNALIKEPGDGFIEVDDDLASNLTSGGYGRLSRFREIEWADWSTDEDTKKLEQAVNQTLIGFESDGQVSKINTDLMNTVAQYGVSYSPNTVKTASSNIAKKVKTDYVAGLTISQEQCLDEVFEIYQKATPTTAIAISEEIYKIGKKYNFVIDEKTIKEIMNNLITDGQACLDGKISSSEFYSALKEYPSIEKSILESQALIAMANLQLNDVIASSENSTDRLNYYPQYQKIISDTAQDIAKQGVQAAAFSLFDTGLIDKNSSIYNYLLNLGEGFIFNPLFDLDLGNSENIKRPTLISDGTNYYTVAKIEYGQTAGYRLTDLTYAGDLIINAGETITSMLDKIVQMLGNFEYFYDLEGRFVFQKKQTYVNTSWNNIVNNQDERYVDNAAYTSAVQYSFEDSKLITSFANTPNLANLKNDFSIWGTRKGVSGTELPVHMRYAIDQKPVSYKAFDGTIYTTLSKEEYKKSLTDEERKALTFQKTPNPNKLPDDEWWEVKDWATYHKLVTGYYPTETLGTYCSTVKIYPKDYFLPYDRYQGNYYDQMWIETDSIVLKDGKYYNYHGYCMHTYTWWLSYLEANPRETAYFHNPLVFEDQGSSSNIIEVDMNEIVPNLDWRELIYQMALDYRRHNRESDYGIKLYQNNPSYVVNGLTGYEQYYTDMEGFWRQLYNPEYVGTFETAIVTNSTFGKQKDDLYFMRPIYKQCKDTDVFHADVPYFTMTSSWKTINTQEEFDHRTETLYNSIYEKILPFQKFDGDTYYAKIEKYTEVEINKDQYYQDPTKYYYGTTNMQFYYCNWYDQGYDSSLSYFTKTFGEFNEDNYWLSDITEYPETLNFWFDFLDSNQSDLGRFSVTAVGDRPKSANDNTVKAIYFRETPTVIFMSPENAAIENQAKSGYSYIQLSANMENLFSISSQGKSAKDVLDEWLYQYSYCAQSITVQAIPVYYLQPNVRIYVRDDTTDIDGEYIITKLTLPLTAKGTMSINAIKAVERIY